MTVKELIKMDIDIDVVDDVCEELYIAFVGPQQLTEQGAKNFANVLDLEVNILGDVAVVCVDDTDAGWEQRLKAAKKFFHAAAGYCSVENYDAWFEEGTA